MEIRHFDVIEAKNDETPKRGRGRSRRYIYGVYIFVRPRTWFLVLIPGF